MLKLFARTAGGTVSEPKAVEASPPLKAEAAAEMMAPPADPEAEKRTRPEFDPQRTRLYEPFRFSPRDLVGILKTIENDIHGTDIRMKDETEKHRKYRIDDCRRVSRGCLKQKEILDIF